MRVALHPGLDPGQIERGNEVVLNESFSVIGVRDSDARARLSPSRRSSTSAASWSTGAPTKNASSNSPIRFEA